MTERVHEVQDSRGTHWIPPAAGEGGEVGEFICGDGGGGCGMEATWYCRCGGGGGGVFEEGGEGACCWSEGHFVLSARGLAWLALVGYSWSSMEYNCTLQIQKLIWVGLQFGSGREAPNRFWRK